MSSGSMLEADSNATLNRVFHSSGMLLAVATPIAFLAPASVALPLDVALGVLFPLHGHIAMNYVVTDYVPKGARSMARGALLLTSVIAAIGLAKLNFAGDGVTGTVKAMWKKPEAAKK